MNLQTARLTSLVCLALAGGCSTSSYTSESVLIGDSGQRIELTGFAFQTSEQGDTKTATFADHRALFVANAALLGITMVVSMVLPPAPETNRRIRVPNSRFGRTPLPGSGMQTAPALDRATAEKLPVGAPAVSGRVGS